MPSGLALDHVVARVRAGGAALAVALKAGNEELATRWEDCYAGTRDWLRELGGS